MREHWVSEDPAEPTEPKRVTHEVCKRALGHDFSVRWGDEEEDGHSVRIDSDGVVVIASVTMFEHETYDPPPWVRLGIETKGWWIRHRKAPATGLTFHGAVDWKTVAEGLAAAMQGHKKPTKAEQDALDNFGIALAEEALAQESHQPEEIEGSPDGGASDD